jgi:hypothetical protein
MQRGDPNAIELDIHRRTVELRGRDAMRALYRIIQ